MRPDQSQHCNPDTTLAYLSTHLAGPHSEALPGPLIHVHFPSFVPTHSGMPRDLVLFIHLPCQDFLATPWLGSGQIPPVRHEVLGI
jgi:hypothetical protein